MMKYHYAIAALPALALLAGCVTTPREAAPAYFALGTEPFWNLEITPEQLTFYGADLPRTVVPNPGARRLANGRAYDTRQLQVIIRTESCNDGMSERQYTETVQVRTGDRSFSGCGGGVDPSATSTLERSSWRITSINGQPALTEFSADIAFADGRITGTTGCNRLMGGFTQARERLNFSAFGMTRMACDGPRNTQEQRIAAILSQPLTIRFGERMTMTWTAPDGSIIALRRLDLD